jgi:hypothetical protein
MPHCWCPNHRLPHLAAKNEERFISEIENGTIIGYKYLKFEKIAKIGIKYRTYDKKPNGRVDISLSMGGGAVGSIMVENSENWTYSYGFVNIEDGIHPLYFEYKGEGSIEIIEIELI